MKILQLCLILAIFTGLVATVIYITGLTKFSDGPPFISAEDISALENLHTSFKQCVSANGMGLQALKKDYCWVTLMFPRDTIPKWKDPKTGELEHLSFDFNLCETLAIWEQVRNSSTILTREYIDSLPRGWEEYAWRRINKGILLNKCQNKTLCMEKLSLVLPDIPPFVPHQFGRCAVVGNSGDLLKTKFGKEIDSYDAVIRGNGAPTKNYTQYVGQKVTFRLLNRGSAKALDKVAALDDKGKEVLIIKTTIHDIMSKMIREVPIRNPVYLMLGTSFGSSAKGTGVKALEFALSVCNSVDIYGFTVDPGYTEWTRYFSESRGGHTPLQGRAYYQMMECLGLIRIHSPMRPEPDRIVRHMPDKAILYSARIASERILGKAAGGTGDSLASCALWKRRSKEMLKELQGLRKTAVKHQNYVKGVTMYPLEHSSSNEMLCISGSKLAHEMT